MLLLGHIRYSNLHGVAVVLNMTVLGHPSMNEISHTGTKKERVGLNGSLGYSFSLHHSSAKNERVHARKLY